MHDPITVEIAYTSMYHTTTPMYMIALRSAFTLPAIYFMRRRKPYELEKFTSASNDESSLQADIDTEKRKVTFAPDISK